MSQNWHRDYHLGIGRYIETDPIGLKGGLNRFVYARNSVTSLTDPTGLAFFAKRGLSDVGWLSILSNNMIDDYYNTEISHEQLFFEDGESPTNLGLFESGGVREDYTLRDYKVITMSDFNDCVMRKAVYRVKVKSYCLLTGNKYNCQDWASEVRKEYYKLINDSNVRRKCCLN